MPAALPSAPSLRAALCGAALSLCGALQAQDLPGQLPPTAPSSAATAAVAARQGERTFLMSAFMATSQDRLSLFTSSDGVNFSSLGSEVWQPPAGLLRDPSIVRAADGLYYIAYTTN